MGVDGGDGVGVKVVTLVFQGPHTADSVEADGDVQLRARTV